jgi:hypothetical protein
MTPGIYHNLSRAEYDAIPALNQSTVKKFGRARSPYHYRNEKPRKQTAEMMIGSAVDCLLFTPERYADEYAVWDGERRGSDWKAFKAENQGKSILNASEFDRVEGCIRALKSQPDFNDATRVCKFQVAAWCAAEINMKALIDMLPPVEVGWVFDLKTAGSAEAGEFGKQCYDLGYDIQAAWTLRILELLGQPRTHFGFYIVENDEPFAVNRLHFRADSREINDAEGRADAIAQRYEECRSENLWPDYDPTWKPIKLPPWAYKTEQKAA